jgi:tRNA modification GTPase
LSLLYFTQLTPSGRGAVATLLVEGPGAVRIVGRHVRTLKAAFRFAKGAEPDSRHLRGAKGDTNRLVIGRFGPEPGEEVVLRPHSADAVEIHCHGGQAAISAIEGILRAEGCSAVDWHEWAAWHESDPIAAAALAALAEARTERTAAILLDQYHGALGRAIEELEALHGRGDRPAAAAKARELLARAPLGRHLVRPWQVVIAGRPNVGKSSLVNALVGYCRAIVHAAAGTTRDAVTATTAIEGWPVELCDTAGLHATADSIEQAGIALARQRLAQADLVVLVFDRTAPWSADDGELLRAWPTALVVENKIDAGPVADVGQVADLPCAGLPVSALTGEGIDLLLGQIAGRLVPDPPPPGAAVPFTEEQAARIAAIRDRPS